jgi:hypothetical protein
MAILILLSGAVFYFGWIQIRIGPDTCAVAFTKTSGWDQEPLFPGRFIWRWERLIPGNMTIYTFPLVPQSFHVTLDGTLPSSEVYAALVDGKANFAYSFDFSITFLLDPDQLPTLAAQEGIRPDTLQNWYSAVIDRCCSEVSSFIRSRIGTVESADQLFSASALEEAISELLRTRVPMVEIVSAVPVSVSLPDLELYSVLRGNYGQIITTRTLTLAEATSRSAEREVALSDRLAELRAYGELLTEYPILLDFLALDAEKP